MTPTFSGSAFSTSSRVKAGSSSIGSGGSIDTRCSDFSGCSSGSGCSDSADRSGTAPSSADAALSLRVYWRENGDETVSVMPVCEFHTDISGSSGLGAAGSGSGSGTGSGSGAASASGSGSASVGGMNTVDVVDFLPLLTAFFSSSRRFFSA